MKKCFILILIVGLLSVMIGFADDLVPTDNSNLDLNENEVSGDDGDQLPEDQIVVEGNPEKEKQDEVVEGEHPVIDENPQEEPQEVQQEEDKKEDEEEPKDEVAPYKIHFEFYKAFTAGDQNLPQEILDILPEDYIETKPLEEVDIRLPFSFWETWTFMGWETYTNDDGSVLFQGIWFDSASPVNVHDSIELEDLNAPSLVSGEGDVLWSGFGEGWVARAYNSGFYNGTNQFLLCDNPGGNVGGADCEIAWCIQSGARVPSVGTTYVSEGRIDSRVAEIIAMGMKNGRSQGAIQAAVWNEIAGSGTAYTTNGENCDPDSSDYNSYGQYSYSVEKFVSGSSQDFAIKPRYALIRVPHGDVRVHKTSSDASVLSWTSNYSLSGAVYGIYSNSACTNLIKTVTTGGDGYSGFVEISPGTVYIKEITPSKGFKLDTNVYTLGVADYGVYTQDSTEDPIKVNVNLRKIGPNDSDVIYPLGSVLKIKLDGNDYATWTVDGNDYIMPNIHLGARIEVEEYSAADGFVKAEKRIIKIVNP